MGGDQGLSCKYFGIRQGGVNKHVSRTRFGFIVERVINQSQLVAKGAVYLLHDMFRLYPSIAKVQC